MQRTGRKTTYVCRSIYSSLSKVEVGGHGNESASKMFALLAHDGLCNGDEMSSFSASMDGRQTLRN